MSDKQQIIRMITRLSKAIQTLGEAMEALDAEEPETFQTKLRGAHAWTALTVEEQEAMLEKLVPGDVSKISPEEFRRRLGNRDRNAIYKAFKERSEQIRKGQE